MSSITGHATFTVVNPLFVSVASVYEQFYGWIDPLIAFAIFFSLSHVIFSKRWSKDGGKSKEGTMVALALGAALAFAFAVFQRNSGFRFGCDLMQGLAGIIFLALLNLLMYLLLHDFLGDEKKKCAFAGSYFIVHSIFLSTFSPLYQQIYRVAPIVTGILAVAYLLAIIQVFMCIFGMLRGSGGDASNEPEWELGSASNGGGSSPFGGGKNNDGGGGGKPGSGPGMKAGDNGPLSVHIIQPQNGINAPLGSRARFIAEVRGGQKPIIWQLSPPDLARPSQGKIGAFSNGFSVDTVLSRPGKFTATVTVTDRNGQRATATTSYTVLSAGVVAGTVVDKERKPLGSVAVKITDPHSHEALKGFDAIPMQTKTKEDGSFTFESVPFNAPLVIRAASGDEVGEVVIPSTGRINNPFVLTFDHLAEIRGCYVVFPEYEYMKPKVTIKRIDGIEITNKTSRIPVAPRQAIEIEIEVNPGNSIKADSDSDKRKKLKLEGIFVDQQHGAEYHAIFQLRTDADGLRVEEKEKDGKTTHTWKYKALVSVPGVQLTPYGEYRLFVAIEDDRKQKAEDDARFVVAQGIGYGGQSSFGVHIESINETPISQVGSVTAFPYKADLEIVARIKGSTPPVKVTWEFAGVGIYEELKVEGEWFRAGKGKEEFRETKRVWVPVEPEYYGGASPVVMTETESDESKPGELLQRLKIPYSHIASCTPPRDQTETRRRRAWHFAIIATVHDSLPNRQRPAQVQALVQPMGARDDTDAPGGGSSAGINEMAPLVYVYVRTRKGASTNVYETSPVDATVWISESAEGEVLKNQRGEPMQASIKVGDKRERFEKVWKWEEQKRLFVNITYKKPSGEDVTYSKEFDSALKTPTITRHTTTVYVDIKEGSLEYGNITVMQN
jgi:hypothetical protein